MLPAGAKSSDCSSGEEEDSDDKEEPSVQEEPNSAELVPILAKLLSINLKPEALTTAQMREALRDELQVSDELWSQVGRAWSDEELRLQALKDAVPITWLWTEKRVADSPQDSEESSPRAGPSPLRGLWRAPQHGRR